ncbi:MAG: histidine kinase [Lachnospiraceae bacterium]|nr:histidine kinase [Lachnospiraceae bacterium]
MSGKQWLAKKQWQGKPVSGIQIKFLKYSISLLFLALLLSIVFVWFYMKENLSQIVIDKYDFMNEKMGMSLDNLFQKTDQVTADCILYEDVQDSLKSAGLNEMERTALSKYFAYIDLDHVAEYCYVDNKGNVYSRSYSKITYDDVEKSGFSRLLGDEYSRTKWFWTEDTLFGTGEPAMFIGRYVRSMEYAHEPGMLFFKMDGGFLEEITGTDRAVSEDIAVGIMDANGRICTSRMPEDYRISDSDEARIRRLAKSSDAGMIVSGENLESGVLSAYRQQENGIIVFSLVPDTVLNRGMNRILMLLVVIYVFIIIAAASISIYFSKRFTKPIQYISREMAEFDGHDFSRTIELYTNTELDQIGDSYNKMLKNIELLLEEIKEQEQELRTSEMNTLISQINPHFLYNTLDTIYMLARINKEATTMRMIQALSKYLRLSLSKGNDIVTVEDELENVKSYMEIQQIRNDNLFQYEIDCRVNSREKRTLKLILQPLVENSIKYGFCDIFEDGIIRIVVDEEAGNLIFRVYNNGTPMEQEMLSRVNHLMEVPLSRMKEYFPDKAHGYGVINIATRLRLKYGEQVQFYYETEENGTWCTIRVPVSNQ